MESAENGSSRAPADGETSKRPPKGQRKSSHYDRATNPTAEADKKRKRDSTEREDDVLSESGGGGGRSNTGKRRKEEEEGSENSKFACPFYKNDPQALRGSRTCVGPGWSSVHRVKEHIFRRHILPERQCHDCLGHFETQAELDQHLEAPCRQEPPLKFHGINKNQEKQLRSRKMYRKSLDEEEKWRAVYKITFPDEVNIPSSYYEPEVPESPDCYRQLLIQKLTRIITKRLTAPESGLMKHITANAMTNAQNLYQGTNEAGRKLNRELNLTGPTQVPTYPQLVQQIKNVVEAAVRKTLSQVDGPKEPNNELQIPAVSVESTEVESKASINEEKQVQLTQPTLQRDNLLQPPGNAGTDLKYESRITTLSSRSSTFKCSPGVRFGDMEQSRPTEPVHTQPTPQEINWAFMFDESPLDNVLQHTTGGNPFPEHGSFPGIWDNNGLVLAGELYASAGPDLNLNALEPASF
ncbi:hypothetical protein FALCPG4_008270 [Fusarium falciforme]